MTELVDCLKPDCKRSNDVSTFPPFWREYQARPTSSSWKTTLKSDMEPCIVDCGMFIFEMFMSL